MKLKLAFKTLYRSPVRTVITIALLVAVTFALFSQVIEYSVALREMNRAAEQYDGVGAIEVEPAMSMFMGNAYAGDPRYAFLDPRIGVYDTWYDMADSPKPYERLTQEQIDAVSALPYVESVDMRYMTAGVSENYVRLDDGNAMYNYTATCLSEGTLVNIILEYEDEKWDIKSYKLVFTDSKLVSGVMKKAPSGVSYFDVTVGGEGGLSGILGSGNRATDFTEPYTQEFIDSLVIGDRYAIVSRYEPNYDDFKASFYWHFLGDRFVADFGEMIWNIDGAPENYLELPEYADIKQVADIIDLGHHTFDMVYTDDTSSIMRFAQGDMTILEGRGIEPADSVSNPYVCVVSSEFAQKNKLSVGDRITMNLGDKLFEQYASLGAVPIVPERVSDSYTEAELEIVGIYVNLDSDSERAQKPNWVYSLNAVFVPQVLLNVSETEMANHSFTPSEFSFKVSDISAFMEKSAPLVKKSTMGVTLKFEDQGWLDIAKSFEDTKNIGFIKICVLSAAVIVAVWFTAFIFVATKKKDYAIMRLLGTPKELAGRAIYVPFLSICAAAVLIGACASIIYTRNTIDQSNVMAEVAEFAINTDIPPITVVICVVAAMLLATAAIMQQLSALGKRSPLELMQGNNARRKKLKEVITEAESAAPAVLNGNLELEKLVKHKKFARRFVWKYVFRHIRRTYAKSVLVIVLAVLLLNVVGQLNLMKTSYAKLVEETVVTSNFTEGFTLSCIEKLEESGYVKDIYYTDDTAMEINQQDVNLVVTNDIARFTGEVELDIVYDDGYDSTSYKERRGTVIMSAAFAEENGLELGDGILISTPGYFNATKERYVLSHREEHPDDTRSDDEIALDYMDDIISSFQSGSDRLVIVGLFTEKNALHTGQHKNTVFSAGISGSKSVMLGDGVALKAVEATVADNNLVYDYRDFGVKLAEESTNNAYNIKNTTVVFLMDTSKLESLRNTLRLVEMLYPIAIAIVVIIGAFVCALLIMQTSKDIAIMRVLGTSKAKTRTILVLEQMILCILGVLLAGVIIAVRGVLLKMLAVFALYITVVLLSAVCASVAASRKNVLELLQTKE